MYRLEVSPAADRNVERLNRSLKNGVFQRYPFPSQGGEELLKKAPGTFFSSLLNGEYSGGTLSGCESPYEAWLGSLGLGAYGK